MVHCVNDKVHRKGVAIMMSPEASKAMLSWKPISERVIYARFQTKYRKVTFIQAYAPTEDAEDDVKDTFHNELQGVLQEVPKHDMVGLI